MKAQLIIYKKGVDELNNIIEVKLWQLPKPTADKPHGYKYSLVYIVEDMRVIGYDNAEGKGDHRHVRDKTESYRFVSLRHLTKDFYNDVEQFKRGEL